jgi:hypothetical protein
MAHKSTVLLVAILATVLLAVPAVAQLPLVTGTSAAEPAADPGFAGYWRYCFDITWDLPDHSMSHTSVFLNLAACTCVCDAGYFAFADTVGSGPGEPDCTVFYHGLFECGGDPHFPGIGPTVKFEPYESDCEPGRTGSLNACFYSLFPPTEEQTFDADLGLKYGQATATGGLVGVLPDCECEMNPVERATWGTLKALYRG